MVTSIAKYQNSSAVDVQRNLAIADVEGLEGYTQKDVVLPRRKIIQLTSQVEGEQGAFYDNLTNLSYPEMEVVILRIAKGRLLWTPGENRSEQPECRSNNAIHGRYWNGTEYGERACYECDFNPDIHPELWDKEFDKNRDRRCPAHPLFLCWDYQDQSMFMLDATGMSAKSVKPIISLFAATKRPVFSALCKFTTQLIKDDKGKYYVMRVTKMRWLEPQDLMMFRDYFQSMKGVQVRDIDEADEPPPPPDTYDDDPGPAEEPYSAKQPGMDF